MAEDKKSTVTINDETTKREGTVTSDELGVTAETAKSITNNVEDNPTPKPAKAPTPDDAPKETPDAPKETPDAPKETPDTPKEIDDAEPWGDKAPTTEDDLINELFYHGGMAKNVAKDLIEKLKATKDTELKADMINHIAWHIGTGGPENKADGDKGKALHKKDILDYLKTL